MNSVEFPKKRGDNRADNQDDSPRANTSSAAKLRAPAPRAVETFRVRRGEDGWYLVPADAQRFPLLTRMYGCQGNTCTEVHAPLHWETLAEGLALLRSVARDMGLGLRICGHLTHRPTVHLREKPANPVEPMAPVFAGVAGDAAKWGISDFYDEAAIALKGALASRKPFTTGWFGVKKELLTGRVRRERTNGPVLLDARASMDDWPDLVDTAVWAAGGKLLQASSGFDTLLRLGLTEAQAQDWVERLVNEEASQSALEEGNSTHRSYQLAFNARFETVCERLDKLGADCEQELQSHYDSLAERCAQELSELKRELRASCTTCCHFRVGVAARSAACAHPKHHALLSANRAFPFQQGCKFWESCHRGTTARQLP